MRTTEHGDIDAELFKRRKRRKAYDEGANEPARLIDMESAEVEAEVPAEENEAIETIEQDGKPETPAFEDDEPSG
jgi:hypothetical protein